MQMSINECIIVIPQHWIGIFSVFLLSKASGKTTFQMLMLISQKTSHTVVSPCLLMASLV